MQRGVRCITINDGVKSKGKERRIKDCLKGLLRLKIDSIKNRNGSIQPSKKELTPLNTKQSHPPSLKCSIKWMVKEIEIQRQNYSFKLQCHQLCLQKRALISSIRWMNLNSWINKLNWKRLRKRTWWCRFQ